MTIKLSLSAIQGKARHYCAYQERSHREVIQKLYGFGLHKNEVDSLIAWLIEENYLNEERFAIKFAGGKFRMKQWGRIKIKAALQQHKVGMHNINTALNGIEENTYQQTLQKLALKKWNTLKKDLPAVRKIKTTNYLLQKGFERLLILHAINKLAE